MCNYAYLLLVIQCCRCTKINAVKLHHVHRKWAKCTSSRVEDEYIDASATAVALLKKARDNLLLAKTTISQASVLIIDWSVKIERDGTCQLKIYAYMMVFLPAHC